MMVDAGRASSQPRTRPPLWVVEGLDVVERRRLVLLAVTGTIVIVGALLAWLAPGIVPPRPGVGAAIAVAALLLGLAAAVAVDATDLYIRGPRHVSAAGGELVAVLSQSATAEEALPLAAAVFEAREPDQPLLLGLAASGKDTRVTVAWTDALATALEAEGASVLRIDLASGSSEPPGLAEVVHDGVQLASAVQFGPEPRLARLGAGADQTAALEALTTLPGRLPRDLDVLLVALPMAASRQVVGAVRSLDHILIVAQRDRTSRVELIAGLDALEAAGTRAQVALVDEQTAARLGAGSSRSAEEPTPSAGFTAQSPAGGQAVSDDVEENPPDEERAAGEALAEGEVVAAPSADPAYDELATPAPGEGDVVDPMVGDDEVVDTAAGEVEAVGPGETPAAGTPAAGTSAAGTPAAGTSAAGTPDESDASSTLDPAARSAEASETATVADETVEASNAGETREAGDAGAASDGADVPGTHDEVSPEPGATGPADSAAALGVPAPDADDEVASDARSAEVLNAAAAAAALAQVVSEDEPVPVRFTDAGHDSTEPDGTESADVEHAAEHADVHADDDGAEDGADAESGDPDRTDELPRVDGSPPVRRVDDDHDDLLRTTAQLSALVDDLDDQGR